VLLVGIELSVLANVSNFQGGTKIINFEPFFFFFRSPKFFFFMGVLKS
jgi:hypothetical protein